MIAIINDRKIDVPADMSVNRNTGFAGAYDYLEYRGFEISPFEPDDDDDTEATYAGPFCACDSYGNIIEADDLAEIRFLIDLSIDDASGGPFIVVHPVVGLLRFDLWSEAHDAAEDIGEALDLNSIGTLKARSAIVHTTPLHK